MPPARRSTRERFARSAALPTQRHMAGNVGDREGAGLGEAQVLGDDVRLRGRATAYWPGR